MEHSYIKFFDPTSTNTKRVGKAKSNLQRLIGGLVSIFIPKANPDFEAAIDNVAEWLLEINNGNKKPNREIGVDKEGQTILIMPWRDNYGYWSDNDIAFDYFKEHFKAVDIDKGIFEARWNAFVKQNSFQKVISLTKEDLVSTTDISNTMDGNTMEQ